MKRIALLIFIIIFAACGGDDKRAEEIKETPLTQSKIQVPSTNRFQNF